jgi:CubicO group peptidase (beta-lactamase class C family)
MMELAAFRLAIFGFLTALCGVSVYADDKVASDIAVTGANISAQNLAPGDAGRENGNISWPPGIADPNGAVNDWRYSDPVFFWRLMSIPKDPTEPPPYFYWPSATIAGNAKPFPAAAPAKLVLKDATRAALTTWAENHKTNALLILHKGKLEYEGYWNGAAAGDLLNGRAITRSITPMVLGFAIADGTVRLDDSIGKYIPEWASDKRGAITVQQLAQNSSGLEVAKRMPTTQIAGNKDLCLVYCGDVVRAALEYDYAKPPGSSFEVAQQNMQLLALVIERATGQPIQTLLSEKIWRPIGASDATFQLDRPDGKARTMCCMRATARDWARLGTLLLNDGKYDGRQILPPGWVAKMSAPSPRNASFGIGLWRGSPYVANRTYFEGQPGIVYQSEPFLADDVVFMEGGGNRMVYAIPSAQLVIFRHGETTADWDNAFLVNTVIRDLNHKGQRQ